MTAVRLSLCLLLTLCACTPGAKHFGTFRSSAGYTARYPYDWHQLEQTDDHLDLLSTDEHVEAIVIAPGEANLTVHDARADDNKTPLTLDAALTDGVKDDILLSRADIAVAKTARFCSRIVEQRSRDALDPDGSQNTEMADITAFFCVLGPRVVMVRVMNWHDDAKEAAYVATALSVAESIRAD